MSFRSMEAVSEVLLRNRGDLGSGPLFLVNPPPDGLVSALQESNGPVEIHTQDFRHLQAFTNLDLPCTFGISPRVPEGTRTVILRLAREKERFEMLLHALAASMPPGARLWVVGEKRAGIQSAPKRIARYFASVSKRDNARHCALLEAGEPSVSEPFAIDNSFSDWPIEFAGTTLRIATLPGVFAHGRLDKGTELLLQAAGELSFSGEVLDFACGSGVIGACLKTKHPGINLNCLDVSAMALAATARTLETNGAEGCVIAGDGLSGLTGRFDWIVSNPPFHQGIRDDLDVAADFFRRAGTFLNEKGKILVVFNRHLPYMGWIKQNFDRVESLQESREFRVVQANR